MLKSSRSRTITATRRASIARCSSLNSAVSRAASAASLSPRSGRDASSPHGTAADAAAAPFPELEGDLELQMPPLAVSPSGEIWVQARCQLHAWNSCIWMQYMAPAMYGMGHSESMFMNVHPCVWDRMHTRAPVCCVAHNAMQWRGGQ